ncbi:unnamed protein product [Protopolystoma xenopodis]|uniref:Uncharacterized protein n=1 Tax=Protopolystoma xenopodis TaxID=117903 RepID=A0A448X2Y3_9PLAT|nr:unnamed protein product [Protopolystoma xenopodis]
MICKCFFAQLYLETGFCAEPAHQGLPLRVGPADAAAIRPDHVAQRLPRHSSPPVAMAAVLSKCCLRRPREFVYHTPPIPSLGHC